MRVTHLSLSDFRNYRNAEVTFNSGPNLVIGRNGQGKTNLVEAIAYFASLSSHRVSSESALIRQAADSAISRMRVAVGERDVLLEVQLNRGRPNRAQVNRNSAHPRELTRWFSCVLFAPEDLTLVRGEPGGRRRFLDEAVTARQPAFAATLSDYERVLKQRTALLKNARTTGQRSAVESTLTIWDEQLSDLGAQIMLARRELIEAIRQPLRTSYAAIVQHDHSPMLALQESVFSALERNNVSRETSIAVAAPDERGEASSSLTSTPAGSNVSRETLTGTFREALQTVRRNELDRGMTLVGPHRDELLFELNDLPVKGYASHGESWSFALALRLALATLLREESDSGDPVIILDDVFAELDASRRTSLMNEVSRFEQVIVTAAVEEDVPSGDWHRVQIESGAIVQKEFQ